MFHIVEGVYIASCSTDFPIVCHPSQKVALNHTICLQVYLHRNLSVPPSPHTYRHPSFSSTIHAHSAPGASGLGSCHLTHSTRHTSPQDHSEVCVSVGNMDSLMRLMNSGVGLACMSAESLPSPARLVREISMLSGH